MPTLREIAEEIQAQASDGTTAAYIHRTTGELVHLTDEDRSAADCDDLSELPEWQREAAELARRVLDSDEFVRLPERSDLNEYRLMEEFIHALPEGKAARELADAIEGRGAFRRFKDRAYHHGLLEAWYAHLQRAWEDYAADFLDEHGIPYARNVKT